MNLRNLRPEVLHQQNTHVLKMFLSGRRCWPVLTLCGLIRISQWPILLLPPLRHRERFGIAVHIYGWPVIVGLRSLDALIAERPAQPSFRQQMNIRGKYRWMASRKDLRLFSPGMSATFTVPRATTLWNHRAVRPPDIGRFPSPVAWIELSRPPGSIQQPHQRERGLCQQHQIPPGASQALYGT